MMQVWTYEAMITATAKPYRIHIALPFAFRVTYSPNNTNIVRQAWVSSLGVKKTENKSADLDGERGNAIGRGPVEIGNRSADLDGERGSFNRARKRRKLGAPF